jgi:trehalose synthase
MRSISRLPSVDDYAPLIGRDRVARIKAKARALRGASVVHVSATYYGGGVAEMLAPLTLLMNSLGITTAWRIIRGTPEFFKFTKYMHNALQGGPADPAQMNAAAYEQVIHENAVRNPLETDRDVVIVHDPQPLALVEHYRRNMPWIWRCHLDLTDPEPGAWSYLAPWIAKYDAAILSCPAYARDLPVAQHFFLPAIHPFTAKHREMSRSEIDERLAQYRIPTDLPLVVQVSRFDRWKDPSGVVEAFRIARKKVPATLVLLGNFADDDPEGREMFEATARQREERILVLPHGDDPLLVNSLQRRAAVVLQKSLREGFGLTVAEAMLKGTPVIGGAVGGIRHQIDDGDNGFLVSSVEQAAERIVQLLLDPRLRARMGEQAREKVRKNFLLTRYLEQYLDLLGSLEGASRPSRLRQVA